MPYVYVLATYTLSLPSFALMLRCWSANPSARPTFSEVASSLDTILKSVADYVEIQMNLVPAKSEVDEGGYEVMNPAGGVGLEGVESAGVGPGELEPENVYKTIGAEEDEEIAVYRNSDQTDDILVHPNPVYGERGGNGGGVSEREEMGDIPVHPNPVYRERSGTDGGGGVGEREDMDDIPVYPNAVYGERGVTDGVGEREDILVHPNPVYGNVAVVVS